MSHLMLVAALIVVVVAGLILPPATIIWLAVSNRRKRERIYCAMSQRLRLGEAEAVFIRVRYASQRRFKKFWKVFPWEGAGLLRLHGDEVTFFGQLLAGAPIELPFDRSTSQFSYVGRRWWPNGALSWFCVTSDTSKQYFSTETGDFVFGSAPTTKQIARLLQGRAIVNSCG